jgi:hypothetical protein
MDNGEDHPNPAPIPFTLAPCEISRSTAASSPATTASQSLFSGDDRCLEPERRSTATTTQTTATMTAKAAMPPSVIPVPVAIRPNRSRSHR